MCNKVFAGNKDTEIKMRSFVREIKESFYTCVLCEVLSTHDLII